MDWFEVRLALKSVLLPPVGLLLVIAAGLVIARRRRAGWYVVVGAVATLVTLAMPATAILLTSFLDPPSTVDVAAARRSQALVIVGGGGKLRSAVTDDDGLGRLSVERIRYGARLARLTRLPVLVTGGTAGRGGPEAAAMAHALEREFGLPPRWVEAAARDTRQNAELSRQVLQKAGAHRIVLVVHAFDMKRARLEFERAGFEVLSAPVGAMGADTLRWPDFIPGVAGLESSYFALYELLANLLLDRRDHAMR